MIRLTLLFLFFTIPAYACQVEAKFSPRGGIEDAIIKEIRNAKDHVYVAAYVFTSQPIALELEAARIRGVNIRVVIDDKQTKQTKKYLSSSIFPIRYNGKFAIQHSKYISSGDTIITGSYNFTKSAEVRNSENIVIIKNCPQVVADYESNFNRLWQEAR